MRTPRCFSERHAACDAHAKMLQRAACRLASSLCSRPYCRHEAQEYEHGYNTAHGRSPCRTFDTHGRTAPVTEDKGVVAADVHDINRHRGKHRVERLARRAQYGAERERECLEERQRTGYLQICHAVSHKILSQTEHGEYRLRPEEHDSAEKHAEQHIDYYRDACYLYEA